MNQMRHVPVTELAGAVKSVMEDRTESVERQKERADDQLMLAC